VLANDDLLTVIFAHLDHATVGQVRLISHLFEAIASPYLFATLRLGFRKRYMRRLRRVAAEEKFAKGVRKIVWDTAPYTFHPAFPHERYDAYYYTELMYLCGATEAEIDEPRSLQQKVCLCRLNRLASDKQRLIAALDDGHLHHKLVEGLRTFTGLKAVKVPNWSSEGRSFFDRGSIVDVGKLMPPPLLALDGYRESVTMQNRGFAAMLGALAGSGRQLCRLKVAPTGGDALSDVA